MAHRGQDDDRRRRDRGREPDAGRLRGGARGGDAVAAGRRARPAAPGAGPGAGDGRARGRHRPGRRDGGRGTPGRSGRTRPPCRGGASGGGERVTRRRQVAKGTSDANVYLPPVSTACPVTARRISVCTTSSLAHRPASAATMAGLERGTPSASSSR